MTISLRKLVVTGPDKGPAVLDFSETSHLIFGPTDTGKSYIVQCIKYCLGAGDRPEDIGYSSGYTRVALQVRTKMDGSYTIFRNLSDGTGVVFKGFHYAIPVNEVGAEIEAGQLLLNWSNGLDKKILAKAGGLGNLTSNDLRRISVFDEIETLNNVPFQGADRLFQTRNKSVLSLVMSGSDDADMSLAPSSSDRQVAKGHVDALVEEVSRIKAEIPEGIARLEANSALVAMEEEIARISAFLKDNEEELGHLKKARASLEVRHKESTQRMSALEEARNRFLVLDRKYTNDLLRLNAIGSAAAVVGAFETKECPLCLTDFEPQTRHKTVQETSIFQEAAIAEGKKISELRIGLQEAVDDINDELDETFSEISDQEISLAENIQLQNFIFKAGVDDKKIDLAGLLEKKTELTLIVRDMDRVEQLEVKLLKMKERTKRTKQSQERNIASSAHELCVRIRQLLVEEWDVPGVESVFFEEKFGDLQINQRKRISYGKGKRGIFLAAFMVALMERALSKNYPHLGFVVIDSPLVTYKDPKHGHETSEDLLDPTVKDRFYDWLSRRNEQGQLIVLENEEPDEKTRRRLSFTEFFGEGAALGRSGFFPVQYF